MHPFPNHSDILPSYGVEGPSDEVGIIPTEVVNKYRVSAGPTEGRHAHIGGPIIQITSFMVLVRKIVILVEEDGLAADLAVVRDT